MGRAQQIKTRINNALKRFGPMDRKVYKRVVTTAGGDSLIGRPGSVTNADTLLSPQPLYTIANKSVDLTATVMAQPGDYRFTFSADSLTLADLKSKTLLLVLKDSTGAEEVLRLLHYSVMQLNGEYIGFIVHARSTSLA